MSEQSKVPPTAAELRELAGWCEGELLQVNLLAGAVAMERVERLEGALRDALDMLETAANRFRSLHMRLAAEQMESCAESTRSAFVRGGA